MRTSTSTLLATVAIVAASTVCATSAAAESSAPGQTAAPAVAAPSLVSTSLVQTDTTSTTTINSVRYDATVRRQIASGGNSLDLGPAARLSPDHTRVAWRRSDFSTATPAYAVVVTTLATKAVATFPLPAGSSFQSGVPFPTWTSDNSHLIVTVRQGSDSVISSLDLATGRFTTLSTLPGGDSASSLAVSADGSIAYVSGAGVTVLPGGRGPARSLHATGTDESCYTVRARPATQREFTYRCDTFGDAGHQVIQSGTPTGTQRTVYTGTTSPSSSPVTYLDDFGWAPSGATLALRTTTVRTVDESSCTQAMTDQLVAVNARGGGRAVVQTEPTITAQACKGFGYGDVQSVVWSPDGQTVVFLHARTFLGPQFAYAVKPSAPGTQTVLARQVVDLSS